MPDSGAAYRQREGAERSGWRDGRRRRKGRHRVGSAALPPPLPRWALVCPGTRSAPGNSRLASRRGGRVSAELSTPAQCGGNFSHFSGEDLGLPHAAGGGTWGPRYPPRRENFPLRARGGERGPGAPARREERSGAAGRAAAEMKLSRQFTVFGSAVFCVVIFSLYLMLDRGHFDHPKSPRREGTFPKVSGAAARARRVCELLGRRGERGGAGGRAVRGPPPLSPRRLSERRGAVAWCRGCRAVGAGAERCRLWAALVLARLGAAGRGERNLPAGRGAARRGGSLGARPGRDGLGAALRFQEPAALLGSGRGNASLTLHCGNPC